jgi:putative phosphoesterase
VRFGVISDVHANRVALAAVLDDMPPVEAVVCAGDVVGYNPWPKACIERVREEDITTIQGNHDRAVAQETPFAFNGMAAAGVEYARKQLSPGDIDWLGSLPTERRVADGRLKVVHGHPDDPDRYTYPRDFSPALLGDEEVLVLGHTHDQHVAEFAEGTVLNPGSVGQPRDGDPDAAYAVVDLDEGTVDLHRVAYDIEAVVAAVEEAGLPERIGTRLREGR